MKDERLNKYFKVLELHRVSIGPIELDIEPGQWRFLSSAEAHLLLNNLPGKKKILSTV
jgi:16S rRNA U516 pseudouridylate synthase RsuA-like enzyme